jgi:CBS domain-containing protein
VAGILSVNDVMAKKVITTRPHATVREAINIMESNDIGSLIVMEGEKPVGIVTERDIVRRVAGPCIDPRTIHVQDIMSRPLLTVKKDASLEEAASLMARRKIKKLAVLENEKLVGVITSTDVVRSAPQMVRMFEELLRNGVKE